MRADEVEMELRREWWLNHGHSGLYGDDGEMQCGRCPADFLRQPLDELRKAVGIARMQRTADLDVEGQDDKLKVSAGTFVHLLGIRTPDGLDGVGGARRSHA